MLSSEWNKTYHKVFQEIFLKSNNIAQLRSVGRRAAASLGAASLTERQSDAALWMKLCLISAWMQTSLIDTHTQRSKAT